MMNKNSANFIRESALIRMIILLMAVMLLFYPHALFAAEHVLSEAAGGFWRAYPGVLGILICILLAVFPRISLLYLTFVTGMFSITLLGLVGWVLAPHILVACIATSLYWHSDPILVIFAWFIAFSGEVVEKTLVRRRF